MTLTLEDSNRMVQAALVKAREMDIQLSIAVCDAGGHLLAFNRMEGAVWVSAAAAQGKAVAATAFGRPSSAISANSPIVQAIMATSTGQMVPAQGALTIMRDGVLIGAIGGSGASGQDDEACAQAGLDAL